MKTATSLPAIGTPAFPAIQRKQPEVLQVNLGLRCNQRCQHCHVSASPEATEVMSAAVARKIVSLARRYRFRVGDITGGAPELVPAFYLLVEKLAPLVEELQLRCNLTAAYSRRRRMEPLLTAYRPTVIASLPCYTAANVDQQRGEGVFDKSIKALGWLNDLGYGRGDGTLVLVYNPLGAQLPPPQEKLEQDYRRELRTRFGIEFDRLLTMANAPIGRFAEELKREGEYEKYLHQLAAAHNPDNLEQVMCRTYISVNWEGELYACDFNLALGLALEDFSLDSLDPAGLRGRDIRTGSHCFVCTAGAGSSCAGALQGGGASPDD